MKIVFEDNDIIVVIKPSGILSQVDTNGGESLVSILCDHTGAEVFPIHRLDREVAGIMVYAKNKKSAAILSNAVADRKFIKEYIALVHGCPADESAVLRDLLFKDSKRNKSFVVKRPRKGVKEAILEYSMINTKENCSALLIKLHTGRTHQIRVQFSSRKMPLCGDRKYGARDNFNKIGLWSYKITFNHPTSGEELKFMAHPENYISEYI